MELTISKSELSRALYLTQSIVERRTTMPILANVLLSTSEGLLKVAATDLEITAVALAKAKVGGIGSTTVNAKVLGEIVKELPEGDVQLKVVEGERLEINAKNSRMKIVGVAADEYPSLPGMNFEVKGKINAGVFDEMIGKTLYAVSTDETRFNLNGVCFELVGEGKKGRSLRMVATDGHRLAMITRPLTNADINFSNRVIVPRKGLAEIRKFLDENKDSDVGLEIRDGFLVLEKSDAKISMRLIDGEFPDYNQVLPKKQGTMATCGTEELAQALRRVALVVTDKGKCVKFEFAKDALRISSSSPELGEAREEVAINYGGAPISVGFNAKYVLDISASLGENRPLVLELNGELGPGKFYAESDDSYVSIVMPMRLT